MKSDTQAWKDFKLSEIFSEVITGSLESVKGFDDGNIPILSSSMNNQGILSYADVEAPFENQIAVAYRGVGAGYVSYHAEKFNATLNCGVLVSKFEMIEMIGLFLSSILTNRLLEKYDYKNIMTPSRMLAEIIPLPATSTGEPDWAYMEQYMRRVMDKMEQTCRSLVRIAKQRTVVDVSRWGEFRVGELFDIEPCKGKNSTMLNDGDDLPYIAASKENNGFNRMVSVEGFEDWISEGNCLQFVHIGDGAAGWCNYVSDAFIGMSGKSSCARNDHMNVYSGLFLSAVISYVNLGKYSFKDSWTGKKVLDTVIKLPITPTGEPDWAYMEQYMRRVMEDCERKYQTLVQVAKRRTAVDVSG